MFIARTGFMVSSDSPDPRRRNTSRSEMRCYTGSKPERLSSASWCWSFFAAMGDGVGGHVCMFLMLVKPMPLWPQIDSFYGWDYNHQWDSNHQYIWIYYDLLLYGWFKALGLLTLRLNWRNGSASVLDDPFSPICRMGWKRLKTTHQSPVLISKHPFNMGQCYMHLYTIYIVYLYSIPYK